MAVMNKYSSIQSFQLPRYDQIPDVGLFLEQVTKYINTYLEPLSGVHMTSSMISNYVKKKLIAHPMKKQYGRDQIAYLLFISVAKSVLALEDVQVCMKMQKEAYTCSEAYTYFCDIFMRELNYVFGFSQEKPVYTQSDDLRAMLEYIVITAVHKIYLDQYFVALRREGDEKK